MSPKKIYKRTIFYPKYNRSDHVTNHVYVCVCVCARRYGYHLTKNSYFICHNQDTIRQLFERLRNYDGENTYPKECQGFAVTAVRDLTTGYDSNQPDLKAVSHAHFHK